MSKPISPVRKLINKSKQPYICDNCGLGSTNVGIKMDSETIGILICLSCGAEELINLDKGNGMELDQPTPTSAGDSKPPEHSCTAEIIAELEELRLRIQPPRNDPETEFYRYLVKRVEQLKAKETQL